MTKIISLKKPTFADFKDKVRALDVKDKLVFVKIPGTEIKEFVGDRVWETCRANGAISVIFIPNHMDVETFTEEDLASIGLMRIPEKGAA